MSSIELQKKVYNQLDVKYPPVIASSNGTIFMYSTAEGLIRLFLSSSENNVEFPKSPFAESRVTCISISPAHTFGATCYEDGSILIYNLIHKKIAKSISKALKGAITHVTFISDTDFITLDSKLDLTLFTLVSMSIFGYTIKSFKLNTFELNPFKLVAPPVHRSIDEIPQHLSTSSYCYAPKFNCVAGISLFKQLIIAKFKPKYEIIYQTDSEIDKPYLTFTLPNPDTLYAGYSTTKEIIILSITVDSSNKYTTDVIFRKPYHYNIHFLSFFSTSFIAAIIDHNQLILYDFLQPDTDSLTKTIKSNGIFFGDFGKIDVFTPTSIDSYYLTSFATKLNDLKNEGKFDDIIELSKKAANGDPGSIVGLSTDPQIRCFEIEKMTNDILKEHLQAQKNFVMKDLADEVVELMIELKNKSFVANDALPIFMMWGGTKEFFTSVLNHDPKGENFTYNQKFVRDIIDRYEQDEYYQKDEEKQHYFDQIKTFLLSLPPKVAKPKWLIDFSLKRKDFMMTIDVCTNRIYDPIMALNLLEAVDHFDLIPDVFLNKVFKGNIEMIEWIVTPDAQANTFPRLEKSIQSSPEKMIEILKWMNEKMAKVQIKSRKEAEEATSNSSSQLLSQESKIKPKSTTDNSKPIILLKDLYIYLKEMNGKESEEEENDDQISKESQLNESSIALAQKKEVVKTNITKSKLTNDYYVNAVIMTLINLKIGYQTDLFKITENHVIKNCPDTFSNPALKYLIESVFSKDFMEPDLRETLLCSLVFNGHVISKELAMSLLTLCEQFEYKEACAFIRIQLRQLGDLLKSVIYEDGLDAALSFINANYRDDLQSMEEIENVVIYYAPYFIEHDCSRFIDVLTNVRFRILYTDLPKSISDTETRLSFMRQLYIKYDPPICQKSENNKSGYTAFLKNLTSKLWKGKKETQKLNEDPITQIYKSYSKGDLDTVYALGGDYFGENSKLILPVILKNMTPEKLKELEQISAQENNDQNEQKKSNIQIASNLINSSILANIQRTIENELAKREARLESEQGSTKAQKDKEIEQQKLDDFYSKAKSELERQAKTIIPFITQYFPQDVITVMMKFPNSVIEPKESQTKDSNEENKNAKSIVDICKDAGLYDCCAYCEALNGNFESATNYLRTAIVIDPIKYEKAIVDTCKLIFNAYKPSPDTSSNESATTATTTAATKTKSGKQAGSWENDDDEEEEEEEEAQNSNENINANNNSTKTNQKESHDILLQRVSFILKSFALQFYKVNDSKKFDQITNVYREVCDKIEISNVATFEEILCITKKTYGNMQKGTDAKFQRISHALVVNRIYSGDLSMEASEFLKSAVAKSLTPNNDDDEEEENETVTIDNTNDELNEVMNAFTCSSCNSKLLVGRDPIAILKCGHALHFKSYCCPAASSGVVAPTGEKIQRNMCDLDVKCPICSKEKKEGDNNDDNKQ